MEWRVTAHTDWLPLPPLVWPTPDTTLGTGRTLALGGRLIQAERALEERGWGMLVSETPMADHAYRVARDERARVRARLAELEAALGRLILEREGFASDPASA